MPPALVLALLLLARATASPPAGVHSLTVEEAVAAGIPLAFSPATALAALHARHAASLPPSGGGDGGAPPPLLPRASLQPHLPALRQVAQLCASAATLGARDSAPLWALFLGLAEAQHAAQAVRLARLERASQQQQQQQQQPQQPAPPLPPPVPRAWLHSEPWLAAQSPPPPGDAPPALLLPLGRALGVDVSLGEPSAGPWQLGGGIEAAPAAVDFLLLDGARSHGELLRDLLGLAPRASKYIGLPHSEYAPREGGGEPPLHTTGVKAAVFDFLFLHNNSGAWEVSAHFANHAGFTLLGRKGAR